VWVCGARVRECVKWILVCFLNKCFVRLFCALSREHFRRQGILYYYLAEYKFSDCNKTMNYLNRIYDCNKTMNYHTMNIIISYCIVLHYTVLLHHEYLHIILYIDISFLCGRKLLYCHVHTRFTTRASCGGFRVAVDAPTAALLFHLFPIHKPIFKMNR